MCITTLADSYNNKLINNLIIIFLINWSIFCNTHATLIDLNVLVKGHDVHIDEDIHTATMDCNQSPIYSGSKCKVTNHLIIIKAI